MGSAGSKGLESALTLLMFEILHRPLVSFCGFLRTERAQVAVATGLGILFARVQAIPAGFQFSNHRMPRQAWMPGDSKALTIPKSDIVGCADCGLSEVVL
jgi:hypothetical protein